MLRAVLLLATPIIAPRPLGWLLFAEGEAEEGEGCVAAAGAGEPALVASGLAESPF